MASKNRNLDQYPAADVVTGAGLMGLTNVRPIIICGMPRSGTRMMTDVLNRVPGVSIQNEMPGPVVEKYFAFSRDIDREYRKFARRNSRRNGKLWAEHKAAVAFSFFVFGSKMGPVLENGEIDHIGLKTPGFERFYREFEAGFSGKDPLYLYTLRNPGDNWHSIKSMGYYSDVELFKTRYIRSIRNVTKMQGHYGERLAVFDLDDFKKSTKQGDFLKDNVIGPLGLSDRVKDFSLLSSTENRNRLGRSGNARKTDEKTLAECKKVNEDSEIVDVVENLKASLR